METALPQHKRSGEIVQSKRVRRIIGGLAAALFGAAIVSPATATGPGSLRATLPAAFERNAGQVEGSIDFIARGSGYQAYLDAPSALIQLEQGAVSMRFEGARDVKAVALEPLGFSTNYFRGTGPGDRFVDVENFGKVRYPGVYPGIDLVYYGRDGLLEYDLVVAPGAAADPIRIAFPEATAVAIAQNGDLRLSVRDHTVVFHKPIAAPQTS